MDQWKLAGKALLIIISVLCTIQLISLSCSNAPLQSKTEHIIQTPVAEKTVEADITHEEIDDAPILDIEEQIHRDKVNEITLLWNLMYDDDKASPTDKRRENFAEYAEYLTEAIEIYERQETDIGGRLPESEDNHLLLAVMIKKESSVDPSVVGAMGEVGLLQIHGIALSGYDPELIRSNPKLGILLGVRWFAHQTSACKPERIPTDNEPWRVEDWAGPLSAYAGGPNAINKQTKKCYHFKVAIDRIKLTKFYKARIKAMEAKK